MANTNSRHQDSELAAARSVTPGPLLFRSPQSHRISSGRISRRRRSASLSLRDINRAAIFEEAIRQSHTNPLSSSLPLTLGAYAIEAAPSLISSASSTPSTVAVDIFPCSEAGTLPISLPSLLSEGSLLGFEPEMEFAIPLHYDSIVYPPIYQSAYLSSLLANDKNGMAEDSDRQSSYSGGYAPSSTLVSASPAMGSRASSVEGDALNESYRAYSTAYSYPSSSATGHATAPAYNYSPYDYGFVGASEPRTHPAYESTPYQHAGHNYGTPAPSYQSQQRQNCYTHSVSVGPSPSEMQNTSEPPKELRCHDHGCNGRIFSTHSNLLRHQREKSGNSTKSECPKCGAQFTRKTAMRGHMLNDKCGKKNGYYPEQHGSSPSHSGM